MPLAKGGRLAKAAALGLALSCAAVEAAADGVLIPGTGSTGAFNVQVTSLFAQRFRTVVKQRLDFSCGSAALATLLTHHYGVETDEETVFTSMFEAGDREKIRALGFSFLDMKLYLDRIGLASGGFKTSLDELARVGVPAILLINLNGFRHFVVVKGVREDEVLVGDPAFGARVYRRDDFEEKWVGGLLFIVTARPEAGRASFNREDEWRIRQRSPLRSVVGRQGLLSTFSLHLPRPNEF